MNNKTYYEWSISGYFDDSKLDVTLNSKSDLAFINYDKVAQILFIDVDVYNRVFGYNETVAQGEALVGTAKDIEIGDVITIGDVPFKVTKRIDDRIEEIFEATSSEIDLCLRFKPVGLHIIVFHEFAQDFDHDLTGSVAKEIDYVKGILTKA